VQDRGHTTRASKPPSTTLSVNNYAACETSKSQKQTKKVHNTQQTKINKKHKNAQASHYFSIKIYQTSVVFLSVLLDLLVLVCFVYICLCFCSLALSVLAVMLKCWSAHSGGPRNLQITKKKTYTKHPHTQTIKLKNKTRTHKQIITC
jgi:hypothetical protein